jgi:hypothetical protein
MLATISLVRPLGSLFNAGKEEAVSTGCDFVFAGRFFPDFVVGEGEELNSIDIVIASTSALVGLFVVLFLFVVVLTGDRATAVIIVSSPPIDDAEVTKGFLTTNFCDRRNIVIGH